MIATAPLSFMSYDATSRPPRSLLTPRDAIYASAVHAVVAHPFVCLSVRLSQAGIVPKPLNVRFQKQRRTIAQGL